MFYTKSYHRAPVRFLQSLFIQVPLTLWFRFFALAFYFWQDEAFVNSSMLTAVQLQALWSIAQQGLATQQIPMNTAGGDLRPANPRALTVQPKNVAVISVPDWSPADLAKINAAWAGHAVPTGSFGVNDGLNYDTDTGVTHTWTRPRIYGAQSMLGAVLIWEFQNVILDKLGYDVSNR